MGGSRLDQKFVDNFIYEPVEPGPGFQILCSCLVWPVVSCVNKQLWNIWEVGGVVGVKLIKKIIAHYYNYRQVSAGCEKLGGWETGKFELEARLGEDAFNVTGCPEVLFMKVCSWSLVPATGATHFSESFLIPAKVVHGKIETN